MIGYKCFDSGSKNIAFLVFPVLIGIILGILLYNHFAIDNNKLIAICTGGLITYSLTSGILLLTMPRSQNKYLERIDKDKRIFGYITTIATPSLLALISTIFSGVKENSILIEYIPIESSFLSCIAQILFWASFITLIWSIYVLKGLIDNANMSGKIPRKF